LPGRAVCPALGTGGRWTPWHANRPPGASDGANEVGPTGSGCRPWSAQVPGWLVGCLRLGVGHASTVRPDPSTWAWWENEAPTTRAAFRPSQAPCKRKEAGNWHPMDPLSPERRRMTHHHHPKHAPNNVDYLTLGATAYGAAQARRTARALNSPLGGSLSPLKSRRSGVESRRALQSRSVNVSLPLRRLNWSVRLKWRPDERRMLRSSSVTGRGSLRHRGHSHGPAAFGRVDPIGPGCPPQGGQRDAGPRHHRATLDTYSTVIPSLQQEAASVVAAAVLDPASTAPQASPKGQVRAITSGS